MNQRMEVNYIVVQAGGKGSRMERLTYNKPKALVSINNLPIIFYLFRKYPDKKYLIVGDYKIDVLKNYLEIFSKVDFKLIDARGMKGTCAGMQAALQEIPEHQAFMITWCDLILSEEYSIPEEPGNYIGISGDFKCRWSFKDGKFYEEPGIKDGVAGHFIFREKSEIADIPKEGEFVRWLREAGVSGRKGTESRFKELLLYHTKEYGYYSQCQEQLGGRCRPFNKITVDGDKIIKEGIDEQGRTLAIRERAWYKLVMNEGFRNIPEIYNTDPLIMERIQGKNIYEYTLTYDEKKKVLTELIQCISQIHELKKCEVDAASFKEAYIGKTFDRLNIVKNLIPFSSNEWIVINGIKCRNVFFYRNELEREVMMFLPNDFCLLHGDCTFSNIMLRENRTPVMIDPRGYFGKTELYGDPAYDWVKLYYSIVGNYDQFNLRRFRLEIDENEVRLDMESNGWEDMENDFFSLLEGKVTKYQMKLLLSIIYYSFTTYAWDDYDSICGAFYKGCLLLEEAWREKI